MGHFLSDLISITFGLIAEKRKNQNMANQSKLQPDSSPELTIKKRCYKRIVPGCNYSAPNGFFKWQNFVFDQFLNDAILFDTSVKKPTIFQKTS